MWYIFVVLTGLFILPIWVFRYPVMGDYPIHLFKVQVMTEYMNPLFEFNKYFTIYPLPCFYSLSYYTILGLSKLFPIQIAGKIFLTLYVILMPLSVIYFLRAHNRSGLTAIISFPLIYNSFLHKGNIGFVASIPATLVGLGYLVRHQNNRTIKTFTIGSILLLIAYLLHPYSLCVIGLVIFITKELRKYLTTIVPSLILLVINLLTLPGEVDLLVRWLSPLMKVRELVIYFFSFSYLMEVVLILPIYGLYLYLFMRSSYSVEVSHRIRLTNYQLIGLSICAFFVLPDYFMECDHTAQRLLPFLLCFGIAAFREPCEYKLNLPLLVIPLLVLYLGIIWLSWRNINAVYTYYHSVLKNIHKKSELIVSANGADLYIGQINVFGHFQLYRLIELGGGISETQFFHGPPVIYKHSHPFKGPKRVIRFEKLDCLYNIEIVPKQVH